MKNTTRVLAMVFAMVLCFSLLAACGSTDPKPTNKGSATEPNVTTVPTGTEPFVAPADQIGKVVAGDATLITWNTYASEDDTIDFMGVDIKALGDAANEMTLFYLEEEVTYYKLSEGKLVDATVEDVVAGAIIGITTLEEGVQEVYIIYTPAENDGSDEYEDVLEDIVEDTVAATSAATEEATPDEQDSGESEDAVYEETSEDSGSVDSTN